MRGDTPDAGGVDIARELEIRRLDTSHPDENRILSIYGVARIGAEVASGGAADVLVLLVFVNVFIGVFNLLPFPPLDGGHVAVATYERIRSFGGRRHQVDAASLLPLTYAVVVLLLLIGELPWYETSSIRSASVDPLVTVGSRVRRGLSARPLTADG